MSTANIADSGAVLALKPTDLASLTPGPKILVARMALFMLVLLILMSMELPTYVHSPSIRWWQFTIIFMSTLLAVSVWLAAEVRLTDFLRHPLDVPKRWFLHHLRRLPPVVAGLIALMYAVRIGAFALVGAKYYVSPSLLFYETVKFIALFGCWLALVYGVLSYANMRQQAENLLSIQKSVAEAKLSQLKAQLRPHFLFNTLNTISSFMQVDVARADRLLAMLGDLLRANLNTGDRNFVALEEELDLLRQYADVMLARFGERVSITWDIGDVAGVTVPTMLLQPLLENAFKHGVERSAALQTVRIRVAKEASLLRVSIYNTGSEVVADYHEGVGLSNCRARLQLLYGAHATLQLRNHPQGGAEVQVSFPWQEHP